MLSAHVGPFGYEASNAEGPRLAPSAHNVMTNECSDSQIDDLPELDKYRHDLLQAIRSYGSCAVAFSGGVDSAVVAKAAQLAIGDRALAVTGTSDSLAAGELDLAHNLAAQIGIRHVIVSTDEFADPQYTRNHSDRCFHCKTELYTQMSGRLAEWRVAVICNGANADDLHDFRPGMVAAQQHQVRSPLAACGIGKETVRQLALGWELPVWDKPAMPCLSSRVAYGEEVTPERLKMIDAAETYLRSFGFANVRVRYHTGDMARIELPLDTLSRIVENELRERMIEAFKEIGFRYITLDVEGFRSGSLNSLVSIDGLDLVAKPTR